MPVNSHRTQLPRAAERFIWTARGGSRPLSGSTANQEQLRTWRSGANDCPCRLSLLLRCGRAFQVLICSTLSKTEV